MANFLVRAPLETAVQLYEGYLWTLTFADTRVDHMPLMSSPKYTAFWTLSYLVFVLLVGPRLMSGRAPFQLRWLLVAYNTAMMLLNLYIAVELLVVSTLSGYSYICEPVDYSRSALSMRMAAVLWWFYASKLIEFADSVFFILRKKYNQLTFLHIYHHSTMFCLWWIGVRWVAGGSAFFGAMLNSGVHTLMYAYYGLTAAFPNVNFWWKKYLTVIQMIQFCVAFMHGAVGLYVDCPFPRWMGWALLLYMTSFIVLFANFYLHAYTSKKPKKSAYNEVESNGYGITGVKRVSSAKTKED